MVASVGSLLESGPGVIQPPCLLEEKPGPPPTGRQGLACNHRGQSREQVSFVIVEEAVATAPQGSGVQDGSPSNGRHVADTIRLSKSMLYGFSPSQLLMKAFDLYSANWKINIATNLLMVAGYT
jgi:hypothetical protein